MKLDILNKLDRLCKVQKQIILDVGPTKENKEKTFDTIVKFMEFRDFSLTDSIRPTHAEFKRKKGFTGIFRDRIRFRLKDLEEQIYVISESNMDGEEERGKI